MPADGLQHGDDGRGDARAQEGAREREHHAFRQDLTEQPPCPGAERRPHRVLGLPLQAAGEQEAGDVGAGDEEQQQDRPEQRHEQPASFAVQALPERAGPSR